MSPEKTTIADAWIGPTRAVTYADAVIQARDNAKTTLADAWISRVKFTYADAYVAELRGEYRGVMTEASRNALISLQANDTVHVVDPVNGTPEMQMWTGSNWISGSRIQTPERGKEKSVVGPTTGGWWADMGNSIHPFRYTDGVAEKFYVDASGGVYGTIYNFGSSSTLDSQDSITLKETVPLAVTRPPAQSNNGNATAATTKSVSWPGSTVAGNLLVFTVACSSSTATVSTPPSGYTLGPTSITNGKALRMYYKPNCGAAEAAPSITFSAAVDIQIIISEYPGVQLASPLDKSGTANDINKSTAFTGTASGTSSAQDLIVGATLTPGINQSGPGGGWFNVAQLSTPSSLDLLVADRILPNPSSGTAFQTVLSPTCDYWGIHATFKAASTVIPIPATDKVVIYAEDLAGLSHLSYKNSSGDIVPLSAGWLAARADVPGSHVVQNSNAKTQVFSYIRSANTINKGDQFILELWGYTDNIATSGTLTFTVTLPAGGSWVGVVASQTGAQTNMPWAIRIPFSVGTLSGASNYISWLVDWKCKMANGIANQLDWACNVATATIDFTASQQWKLEIQWQTANAGNVFKLMSYDVYTVKKGV